MLIILDFMLSICQFKNLNYLLIFLTLLVSSCAKKEVIVETISPTGNWFSTKDQFRYKDFEGEPESHLFFDFKPVLNIDKKYLDVVVVTPERSDFHYEFDLVSGKRYFSHSYCKESDVWKSYEPSLSTPPYTEAFVPRLLDQLKMPQKVVIFGDRQYLSSESFPQDETVRVRVIGGMIEQFCDSFPCDENKKWNSRLVLFAVSPLDPAYKDTHSFATLIKKIDWKEVKAFLENGRGRTINDRSFYPAYRLIGQVFPTKAMKMALEMGHLFSDREAKTLRRSCENVYQKLYNLKKDVLQAEETFPKAFHQFYKRYWNLFKTCRRYVRASSITHNAKDHWFMEYMASFIHAEQMGYLYQCRTKAWIRNVEGVVKRRENAQEEELKFCTSESLNLAFEKAINLMTGLSSSGRSYYRYIQYDSGAKSLGNKIYSWVRDNGKRLSCEKPREYSVYPSDVTWSPIKNPENKDKDVSVYIR